jgi:hypothetical protein
MALILFIKKLNKLLQFYINYYKLNSLSYKHEYLFLLIKKTLTKIKQAYIFIKLDIKYKLT